MTAALLFVMDAATSMAAAQQAGPAKPKSSVDSVIDSVLKDVEQRDRARGSAPASPPTATTAPSQGGRMTVAEIEAVRQALRPCWFTTANTLTVAITVSLAPDGRPTNAQVRDTARYEREPAFRLAADAAYRAVMNPKCQPWPLAPEKYALWRTITFSFDARDP